MLTHHLKRALRSLFRHKGYTVLNIFGLALGVACCVLIFLFIRNELAVNDVFTKADRLYRLESDWREPTMGLRLTTLAPAGAALVEQHPEVVDQARIYAISADIRLGDAGLRRDAWIVDPSIVRMLDLPLLSGDAETALTQPRSVVIRETVAQDVFGTTDVLGRTLRINTWQNGEQDFTITGVWEKLPYNSLTRMVDGDYEILLPSPLINQDFVGEGAFTSWLSRYMVVLIETAPQVTMSALESILSGFVERHAPDTFHGNLDLVAQPITTLHLDANEGRGWRVVVVLATLAGLLLLIACINFTNLATTQSLSRSREIGVRKAVGAQRGQLVIQFLSEALLVAFAATALGGLLAWSGVDTFFAIAEAERVLAQPWGGITLSALLGLALATGLLAGSYPAFFIAGFEPIRALSGTLTVSPTSAWLRKGLVVAQFTIAIGLMIAVAVVVQQVDFILDQDIGYHEEDLLVISSVPRDWTPEGLRRTETIRDELGRIPGVEAVSLTYDTPTFGSMAGNTLALRRAGQSDTEAQTMTSMGVDHAFLATYGLRLSEGSFFRAAPSAHDSGIVLNQTAAQALGLDLERDPVVLIGDTTRVEVVGIVEDFHFANLKEPLRPLVLQSVRANALYRNFTFRLTGTERQATLARIEATWQDVFPGAAMVYDYIDQQLKAMYQPERQVQWVVSFASALAILIACLGLLGMASLTVVQRTKELGVRKVLGASEAGLVILLVKDFLMPLAVAVVIASPVAYLLMNQWLANFALRIDVSGWMFVAVAVMAFSLAALTVGYHARRAAHANPVDSLRYE